MYGDRLNDPWIKVTDPLVPSIGNEYAKTKIEAERIVRDARLDWTIFRLTAVMGKHKLSELLFHMPLSTPLEIATPYDTSTAFVNAIDKRDLLSRRIFNMGGGAAYRTVYKDFLALSFDAIGLGELNFPENSFAEKNFHCGYYYDSNELQDILEFQNGTIDDYFHSVRKSTNTFKRFSTMLFSKVIKRVLLVKSEPLKALQSNDKVMKERFFID